MTAAPALPELPGGSALFEVENQLQELTFRSEVEGFFCRAEALPIASRGPLPRGISRAVRSRFWVNDVLLEIAAIGPMVPSLLRVPRLMQRRTPSVWIYHVAFKPLDAAERGLMMPAMRFTTQDDAAALW